MTSSEMGESPVPSASSSPVQVRPKKQDRTTVVLFLVAAVVAVGGIGFALGHATGSGATPAANASGGPGGFGAMPSLAPGQTFAGGQPGGVPGVGGGVALGITGTVQSISGTTITILEANGSTVTVDLSGTTTYHGEATAGSSDVKVGASVTVQADTTALASGSPNPNASGSTTLTAKDVLITQP